MADSDHEMDISDGIATQTHVGNSEEVPRDSAKRKAVSPKNEPESELTFTIVETSLGLIRITLNNAITAIRIESRTSDAPVLSRLAELMSDLGSTLERICTKEGKLISPLTMPALKKSKKEKPDQPVKVDASTDTILTPSWWDSDSATEARAASRRRKAKSVIGVDALPAATNGGEESTMETDTENWTTVVKKPVKSRNPAPTESRTMTAKPKSQPKKPPAILIRPLEGQSYADTVRTVRSCGLSRTDIGANVKMRETKDGSLLMELSGGVSSGLAAKKITSAISTKLGNTVGKVLQLGVNAEVEILDLDATATALEVLDALREAIPGGDDPTARAERDNIQDVRIWPTRSGQQIASAKMSRYAASVITKIPIGWTMCRVRPRTSPPERCFRCQKFGHNARTCGDSDRASACWRCGETGHPIKECKAAEDNCLACDLAGLAKVPHKPGSGSCAARKRASGPSVPRDG